MSAIPLNLNPDDRTLRGFGFIALGGFGVLSAMAFLRWGVFSPIEREQARVALGASLALLGVLCAVFSLVSPRANKPVFVGLSLLTYPVGLVVSYSVMAAIFFLVFTPVHLGLWLCGRDALQRRLDGNRASYWIRARANRPRDAYFKQF